MDGTLLNSNHEVSDLFFELFEQLNSKGIQFVAASGRQYHSMSEKLSPIKDDIVFIAENGAYVKRGEETLLTTHIDHSQVHEILDLVHPIPDAHPVLCSKDNAYVNGSSAQFLEMLQEYYSSFEVVTDQHEVSDNVLKVAIYHFEDSEKHIYPVVEHLDHSLKVKVSGSNWVDVSHKKAHKGHALKKVMEDFGITKDEILVFGDYNNDLEMLQMTDFSFAMANAHPNVKKAANYTTESNDDYGVERILKKLI